MNTVIIYASSHGTTAKAAQLLSKTLGDPIRIINLQQTRLPDIRPYDAVIIGGSIHAGMMQRKVTKFMKEKEQELLTKKLGLFLCCMYEGDVAMTQFNTAYPESLRNHACATSLFGGEFLFGKMNFFEKMIIKKMKGDTEDVSQLNEDAISQFSVTFKEN